MLGMATMSLREKISRAADAFVDIKVQNLPLQFYLSTLDGLADMFEDEIIPTPIPMKVKRVTKSQHFKHSVPRAVLTFNISNTNKRYIFSTLLAIEIMWYTQFCPKT